jgi:hypothetical protein
MCRTAGGPGLFVFESPFPNESSWSRNTGPFGCRHLRGRIRTSFPNAPTLLGDDTSYSRHGTAASQWTALRRGARTLQETYFRERLHEQFLAEVRRINDHYNTLCQARYVR